MALGAVRSISVKFQAEVGNYVQGLGRMRAATGDLITELSKSEQQRQNFQRLGTGLVIAGAGIAAGIGLATRAAIQWESAWAGVVKTVDGSEAQLAALEGELREMATQLPATHGEIAAVAEAAGQLGVATEDIASFTKTMIDLGESTNLTADEAATSIAQLMNVMGTAPDQVDELGSALVELGNNGASTERDIIQMAQRIAGAGAIVGATEADVLALANALASAGIRVEAGGSAISKVLVEIASSAAEGGDKIAAFARVAGQSADEFADRFSADPVAALNDFVLGLGRMNDAGGNVFGTLDELGLGGIRVRDSLLRLAASGDLLTQSLEDGERAWEQNIALTEEAERRYGTTESKLRIARNQLNDFAISMGERFTPAVAGGAEALGGMLDFLGGLPAPVQDLLAGLAGVSAAFLLVSGSAALALANMARYKASLDQLNVSGGVTANVSGRVARGLRGTVVWAGRATAAFVAMQLAGAAASAVFGEDFAPQMDALTEGIARFGREGRVGGEAARVLGEDFDDLGQALSTLGPEGVGPNIGNAIKGFTEWAFQLDQVQGSLGRSKQQVDAFDQALASLVQSGRAEEAAASFQRLSLLAEENGVSVDRLKELFPAYAAALETATEQSGPTAEGIEGVGTAAGDAADKVDELRDAFDELFGAAMDLDRANIAFKTGMVELAEAVDDGATSLSLNSEAGRDNRSAVLDQIEAIDDLRQANLDNDMSMGEANEKYLNQLGLIEEMLVDRGFEREAVQNLIDTYRNIPGVVSTDVQAPFLGPVSEEAGLYLEILEKVDDVGTLKTIMALPGAKDRLALLRRYRDELNGLDGKTVTTTLLERRIVQRFGVNAPVPERHGGIVLHAQQGLLRPQVFSPQAPARFAFAEPATGGEAFIPRLGDRDRSLAIADQAARWHGGRVVAGDGASVGGPFQWHGARQLVLAAAEAGAAAAGRGNRFGGTTVEHQEVHVQAMSQAFSFRQVMDDLAFHGAS